MVNLNSGCEMKKCYSTYRGISIISKGELIWT
jgi:hypothetical protein